MLNPFTRRRDKHLLWLVGLLLLFGLIYSLVSIVNHYEFRTYALDLGMFNNALFCFAHFKSNYFVLDPYGSTSNYFGAHFDPIIFFFVPFYYVFGSYTLLIIQIAFILAGGLGVYKYARLKYPDNYIPLIVLFQFFGVWGIFSALSFDFHNNVIAAMMVPWFIYFYEKKQMKICLLLFALILICKENMALWMIFIILGLIIKNGIKNPIRYLKFELPLITLALVYFVLIMSVVMPSLQNAQSNYQFHRYSSMGNSVSEILTTLLKEPGHFFALLFESPTSDINYTNAKSELHFMVLLSGGIALLYRPWYLIMLIPIYIQKLISNDPGLWGINGQYSIEFVPILTLASVDFLAAFQSIKNKYLVSLAFVASTYFATIRTIDSTPNYDSQNTRFYSPGHYNPYLNLTDAYNELKIIPPDVPISVSPALAPHLANRYKIYSFPIIKDAEYIALIIKNRSPYPLSEKEFTDTLDQLKACGKYAIIYSTPDCLVFKKK